MRPVSGPYSGLKLVPLLMGPLWCGHKFMMSRVSIIIARASLCKQQLAKTQEGTQIVWRHVAVHIHRLCRRIYFLESATRTQKTAYFSLVKLDLSIFQWRLPRKKPKNISWQIRNLGKKQRRANATLRTILGVFQFVSWQGIP